MLQGQDAIPPERVSVLPVIYVPSDREDPSDKLLQDVMRHLRWTQTRYAELLPDGLTFQIAEQRPKIYRSEHSSDFYEEYPESTASRFAGTLLDQMQYTRYSCPYIFFVVFISPERDYPVGGGRPFNGGYNTGGGIVHLSSFVFERTPNVQSTIEHEIAHAAGLPHVDVYGYDMETNISLMSYNTDHWTRYFEPGSDPAVMIPEDLRGLALNQRMFPGLTFKPERDVPDGYTVFPRIIHLGPMDITGHPGLINTSTPSGETWGSAISNVVQGRIPPSDDDGSITYSGHTMWTSGETETGWVTIQLDMPYEVSLSALRIHSEHSGKYHKAEAGRIFIDRREKRELLAESVFPTNDELLVFPTTTGRSWIIELQAGASRMVVVRGIQFYAGTTEVYPPLVPVPLTSYQSEELNKGSRR